MTVCALLGGCSSLPDHNPRFVDVTAAAGIVTQGGRSAGWADYDLDGCPDLLITQAETPKLYRNTCGKGFVDMSESAGVTGPKGGVGVAWADYDADGDADLYIASGSERNALYRNNGNGTFSNVAAAAGVDDERATTGASWADFDGDGDLDLFVANRFYPKPESDITDRLYRNNGDGTFTDVAPQVGLAVADRKSFTGSWFDYDGNGTQDLYLAIDFNDDRLYRNDGRGNFEDVSQRAGIGGPAHAMGVAVGDINGDGCQDLVVTNNTRGAPGDAEHGPTTIYQNDCNGGFSDRTRAWGVEDRATVDWGVHLVDWDNDGDEDLAIVSGGMLEGGEKESNVLYENRGGRLVDVTRQLGAQVNGAAFGSAWADYDNDGDLDWLIVNSKKNTLLLENQAARGNYLKVRLRGGGMNRDAIGARVELTAAGRTQVKSIQAGKGYGASEELLAHFGLGSAESVERLRVIWPDGGRSELGAVRANQTLKVRQ
jgi:hypothetical protein